MNSMNVVVVEGNLTRDIEVKHLVDGMAVANCGLALNRKKKDGDDEVSFVDLTAFGKSAEIMGEYMGKGTHVLVHGRLREDRWETDGQKRSKLGVVVETIKMLDRKKTGGGESSEDAPKKANKKGSAPKSEDDIPF